MSRYSGKCDLWDSLIGIHEMDEKNDWDRLKLYQITENSYFDKDGWHDADEIKVESVKDLIPYAPFLVSMATYSKNKGKVVYIGDEPYIDSREKESLNWILKDFKGIYRRYKRQKKEFVPEKIVQEYFTYFDEKPVLLEIAERVKKHPCSADIKGLRGGGIYEYFRNEWLRDMVSYGYTEEQAREWIYEGRKTW